MLLQSKRTMRRASPPQVLLDGALVAKSNRDAASSLVFYAPSSGDVNAAMVLSIVVEAVGRSDGGCDWDFKGLQSGNVSLNGAFDRHSRLLRPSFRPGTVVGGQFNFTSGLPHWVSLLTTPAWCVNARSLS